MATQDFTTYVENDANSRFAVTAPKIDWAGLLNNDDDHMVIDDFGVDFFAEDFEFRFETELNSSDNSAAVFIAALTNAIDDWDAIDVAGGSALGLFWFDAGATVVLYLEELDSGTRNIDGSIALAYNTKYYITFSRDEATGTYGTITAVIRTGSHTGTVVDTLSVTLSTSKKDFRYLSGVLAFGGGTSGRASTGYIQNLTRVLAERYWVNDDADSDFDNANNWSDEAGGAGGAGVPTATEKAFFTSDVTDGCSYLSDSALSLKGIEIQAGYTGTVAFPGAPGGGEPAVTIGEDGIVQAAGTLTLTAGTTTCTGPLTCSAGTLNHNDGKVSMEAVTGTVPITSGGNSLYDLDLGNGGTGATFQLQDEADIENDLNWINGAVDFNDQDITINNEFDVASTVGVNKLLCGDGNTITLNGILDQNCVVSAGPFTEETATWLFTGTKQAASIQSGNDHDAEFWNLQIADGVTLGSVGGTNSTNYNIRNRLTLGVNSVFDMNDRRWSVISSDPDMLSLNPTSTIDNTSPASSSFTITFAANINMNIPPATYLGDTTINSNTSAGTRNVVLQGNITVTGNFRINEGQNYNAVRHMDFNGYDFTVTGDFSNLTRGFGIIVGSSTLTVGGDYTSQVVRGTTTYILDVDGGLVDVAGDFTVTGNLKTIRTQNGAEIRIAGSWDGSARSTSPLFEGDGSGVLKFDGGADKSITAAHTFVGVNVTAAKDAGFKVTLASNFANTGLDLTVLTGILDLAGYDVDCDNLVVPLDAELRRTGAEAITLGTGATLTGTVRYYSAAVLADIADYLTAYGVLILGAGKTHEMSQEATVATTFASDGVVGNKAILQSDTPGTRRKLTVNGAVAIADKVSAIDIDSSDGDQIVAIGSLAVNTLNWKTINNPVSVIGSKIIGRPGPRGRVARGVVEWT